MLGFGVVPPLGGVDCNGGVRAGGVEPAELGGGGVLVGGGVILVGGGEGAGFEGGGGGVILFDLVGVLARLVAGGVPGAGGRLSETTLNADPAFEFVGYSTGVAYGELVTEARRGGVGDGGVGDACRRGWRGSEGEGEAGDAGSWLG